jgi:acetyl-CoA carboxylase carboxyltransferase component
MRAVVETCFDAESVFEVQPSHGKAIITALARLGGFSVAVVANDPSERGGAVDASAAVKASRFLEIVGGFHIPVIFLADNPGVLAGTQAERDGVLRYAARMFAAQHRLRVPKISVTLRKAFGFGSSIMAMNPFDGQTLNLAFPGVSLGAMPARGGGAASKADDQVQADLDAHQAGGPYSAADSMAFDEVIDPRELRNALLQGLDLARGREGAAREPVSRIGALP